MKSFCSCLSLVSALLLVFAATSARESLAFVGVVVVVSPTTMMQKTAVAVRMAADEASEPAVSNPAKKQQVNCPNCDLCDGSGRYVRAAAAAAGYEIRRILTSHPSVVRRRSLRISCCHAVKQQTRFEIKE